MPVDRSRSADLERAKSLLAKALDNPSNNEALVAFTTCRELIVRHDLSLGELTTRGDGKPMNTQDWMVAAKSLIDTGKAALTDPELQKTLQSGIELGKAGVELGKGIRSLFEKTAGRRR